MPLNFLGLCKCQMKAKEALWNNCTTRTDNGRSPAETWSLLHSALTPDTKFLCVNDLPQLEAVIPEVRDWLRQAVGGFANA